jgi:hypothetical protein
MTLILKHASASRPSGDWNDDDFDVLENGAAIGTPPRRPSARPGSGPTASIRSCGSLRTTMPQARETAMAVFAKNLCYMADLGTFPIFVC